MPSARTVFAHGFAATSAVLVPMATLPLTISLGNPVIEFYAPKLALVAVATLMGWSAIFVRFSSATILKPVQIVFVDGLTKWISAAMLLIVTAAGISGSDLWTSLIGSSGRLDGALVVIAVFHLMQLSYALVRTNLVSAPAVISYVIAGGTAVALILLMEKSGTHAWGLWLPSITPIANPIATIGNVGALTNFLASIYVLAVVSAIRLRKTEAGLVWIAATIVASGIAVHVGRAGTVGAVLALAVTALALMSTRRPRAFVPLVGIALLISVVYIGSIVSTWTAQRSQLFSVLAPGATADLNLQHRYVTWRIGLRSIWANPVFGAGTGSFADQVWLHAAPEDESLLYTAFLSPDLIPFAVRSGRVLTAYDKEAGVFHVRNTNYSKVHNYFLDLGVAYGLPAMLAVAAVWLTLILAGWRRIASYPELLAASLGYLAALQFWFMSVNVDPALYVAFGALAATLPTKAYSTPKSNTVPTQHTMRDAPHN